MLILDISILNKQSFLILTKVITTMAINLKWFIDDIGYLMDLIIVDIKSSYILISFLEYLWM